jgi:hypothetical protein
MNMTTMSLAEMIDDNGLNLNVALQYHLRCNHYPPLPISLIPLCETVITGVSDETLDLNDMIELPTGLTWRGMTSAPVREVIDWLHLDHFIMTAELY